MPSFDLSLAVDYPAWLENRFVRIRENEKRPYEDRWQNRGRSSLDIRLHTGNVGVLLRGMTEVDLDLHDNNQAEIEEIRSWLESAYPTAPLMRSQGGGYKFFFRGETATRQIQWDGSNLVIGQLRSGAATALVPPSQIEGRHYEWIRVDLAQSFEDLPTLSEADELRLAGARKKAPAETVDDWRAETVSKGGRDNYLTKWAGFFRRYGLSETEIYSALRAINQERCNPPKPDEALQRIAGSVMRYAQEAEIPDKDQSELYLHGQALIDAMTTDQVTERIWGSGDLTLWSKGEPLIICGPTGHGKTSLAQNLMLSAIGIRDADFLGFDVQLLKPDEFVLYLAADRPKQAIRSLMRMVDDQSIKVLAEKVVIRKGPPGGDIAKNQTLYLDMIEEAEIETGKRCAWLIVDSLKDMASGISDDVVGASLNLAAQHVVANGREILILHHQRKQQSGGSEPKTISDVYGSTHIVNGSGSVLLIWADKDDPDTSHFKAKLRLLKEIDEPLNGLQITVERKTGVIEPVGAISLEDLAELGPFDIADVKASLGVSTTSAKRMCATAIKAGWLESSPVLKGKATLYSKVTKGDHVGDQG